VPERDATVVARMRKVGAVLVGKTNMPALAADIQTNNPVFGRTNNPWDVTRTPGGSSGGAAAAVAAGLSPLDIGSDTGGSLRIPAHYCGIYTLKPTEHRVPMTGHVPELPGVPRGIRHLSTAGPLARSVRDLALSLRILAGPDGTDWEVPPVPVGTRQTARLRSLRFARLRVPGPVPESRAIAAAIDALADTLHEHRSRVIDVAAPIDFSEAYEVHQAIFLAEYEGKATLQEYLAALSRRDRMIGLVESLLSRYDALLCPVAVGPAFPHLEPGGTIDVDGSPVPYVATGLHFTVPFNLTGHPVVLLPLRQPPRALPLGVQVVGRRWSEARLLAIAAEVDSVERGFRTPPGF
jgi:amidase